MNIFQKIINFQHRFLAWKYDVMVLGLQSGVLAMLFSLFYVLYLPDNIAPIWAMLGVFVCAVIQTIGIQEGLLNRLKAGSIFAISAGVATFVGCYCGNSFIATSLALLLIVPFVGLASAADGISAAIVLFTVDLFVIASGLPSGISAAVINGAAFALGGISLVIIAWLYAKLFAQSMVSEHKYTFNIIQVLSKYKCNISFSIILTIAVLIGNTIAFFFKMPQGFWIPMTVLLILKSDYDFTKSRMSERLFGTILGSILAIVIMLMFFSKLAMALLMLPLLFFIVVSIAKHYGAYTFILTIMVTVIVNLIMPSGYVIAEHRLLDTIIGVVTVAGVLWVLKPIISRLSTPKA